MLVAPPASVVSTYSTWSTSPDLISMCSLSALAPDVPIWYSSTTKSTSYTKDPRSVSTRGPSSCGTSVDASALAALPAVNAVAVVVPCMTLTKIVPAVPEAEVVSVSVSFLFYLHVLIIASY